MVWMCAHPDLAKKEVEGVRNKPISSFVWKTQTLSQSGNNFASIRDATPSHSAKKIPQVFVSTSIVCFGWLNDAANSPAVITRHLGKARPTRATGAKSCHSSGGFGREWVHQWHPIYLARAFLVLPRGQAPVRKASQTA